MRENKKTFEKITKIEIYGCRWFQKSYGNTYCSAQIYVNDEWVATLPVQYGYERYYEQAASEWLVENKVINMPERDALWNFCRNNGIEFLSHAKDVDRERDLKAFASKEG